MISYQTYKMLHLFFILSFFSSLGFAASASPWLARRSWKIAIGLVSFLILVAGMGLIARLGFKHGEGFPLWINLKFGFWFFINFCFVLLFKVKSPRLKGILAALILLGGLCAVWVVMNKPL